MGQGKGDVILVQGYQCNEGKKNLMLKGIKEKDREQGFSLKTTG